jgi:fumarylacetoacetase
VVLSGRDVHRPVGQTRPDDDAPPVFGPSKLLDYELEMGFITGPGNELGRPIPIEETEEHIFGFVLVNDWSARDIQKWEYQPLGPFNAKNFATSISPWVVTLEALAPFKVAPPEQEPAPLPYLQEATPWSLDIPIDILLESEEMEQPHPVARSNFRHLYWTPAQQLAHHTVTGCNIRPGDLLASGTISGPEKSTRGCLLELTWKGSEPVRLPNGETRTFLKDGDRVTFRATCEKEGLRIGFGEVTGRVLPPIGE